MSKRTINLTLYLILIPYITEIVTETNTFLSIIGNIKQSYVAAQRVNTFLESDERDIINFGMNQTDDIIGNINFSNVSYTNENKEDTAYGKLEDVNFNINAGEITLIKGYKNSGKRQIFYLLNRYIKHESGNILVDNINIFDFSKNIHKQNISGVVYKPKIFKGSIMDNFKMIEKRKKKIVEMCKKIGVHEFIETLPKKYNTNINENKSISLENKFLLALTRALLTKSEILMIYEFPTSLTSKEKENIKNTIKSLKTEKTFIIFSAYDTTKDIADRVIEINDGKVRSIYNNFI